MINKAVLHVLDFNSDICVFSQKELDFSNDLIKSFIEKHLKRLQNDATQRKGVFTQGSAFAYNLQQYFHDQESFIDFSTRVANVLYESILHSDKTDSVDFLVVDYEENDERYIAFLLMASRISYTHQVVNENGSVHNEIIRHYAILPNPSQKIDSYAIINMNTFSIGFTDKRRMIDGKDVFVIPDILLQCTSTISSQETIKTINKITENIAEEHGANSAVLLSKAKTYLLENAEISTTFSPIELGEEIFSGSEDMQNEFVEQVNNAQLPKSIKIEKSLAVRTGKNHKIKTDTGIEITFPAEYFENHDYIEFINNPDGTISIELKNIGKIINK